MTVNSEDTPRVQYTANSITTIFPITFVYDDISDVHVYFISNSTGLATAWTKDASGPTGYTVSAGAIVANTAPSNGYLVAVCTTPVTQLVDVKPNRALTADTLEGVFDKLTLIGRDLKGSVSRALIYGPTYTGSIPYAEDLADEIKQDSVDASVAAVNALTFATSLHIDNLAALRLFSGGETTSIYLDCHTSQLDGGHGPWYWDADSTATDNNGTVVSVTGVATGRWIRQLNGFVTPEMFGGNLLFLSYENDTPIRLSDVYTTSDTIEISSGKGIEGIGYFYRDGTVTSGSAFDSTAAVDTLTITSDSISKREPFLNNFAVIHRGSGVGIKIDNYIGSVLRDMRILCENTGAIGVNYLNYGYFAILENARILDFTEHGVLTDGIGFDHQIINGFISSSETGAIGVEIRRPQFRIQGGQIDVRGGTNIKINGVVQDALGGIISGVAMETGDIGYLLTGTSPYSTRNVVIDAPFMALSTGIGKLLSGVVFDRARSCVLNRPIVLTPSSVTVPIATWGANSIDCGIVVDAATAVCPVSVDHAAVGAWKKVEGNVTNLALVTTAANLRTYVERSGDLYGLIHNGTAWNKGEVTIGDDAFATITPPKTTGNFELMCAGLPRQIYAKLGYTVSAGSIESYSEGSLTNVITTNGTLSGTTGVDGNVTIRASATGVIFIENRTGGSLKFTYNFGLL